MVFKLERLPVRKIAMKRLVMVRTGVRLKRGGTE